MFWKQKETHKELPKEANVDEVLSKGLLSRGPIKSVLEIARKREEIYFEYLQSIKHDTDDSRIMSERYRNEIKLLDWVLNGNLLPE